MSLTNSIVRCQTNHYGVDNGILATTKRSKRFVHSNVISDFIATTISGVTILSTLTDLDKIDLISVYNHSSSTMTLSLDGANYYISIPSKDSCLLTLDSVSSLLIKINGVGFIEMVIEGTIIPSFYKIWDFEDGTLQEWFILQAPFASPITRGQLTLNGEGAYDYLPVINGNYHMEYMRPNSSYHYISNPYSFPCIAGKPITITMKKKSTLILGYSQGASISIYKVEGIYNSYVQGVGSYNDNKVPSAAEPNQWATYTWVLTPTETTTGYLGIYLWGADGTIINYAIDDITITGDTE